jgi:siroheme synthase
MAVGWVEHMARDNQTAIDGHLERLHDEALARFMDPVVFLIASVVGIPSTSDR